MKAKYKVIVSISAFVLVLILISGYLSRGPTLIIETPQPAQDFVVLCSWSTGSSGFIHGGRSMIAKKPYVISSGEEFSCGFSLKAALALGVPMVQVMHPIYWEADVSVENGVKVYRYTKTKLDMLDELKTRFEAGEWADRLNPGAAYARSLVGCGFPHQYFDYYSEVKKVDKDHFKKIYNEPMLECMKRTFPIRKQYLRGFENYPDAEEYIEKMWNNKIWE